MADPAVAQVVLESVSHQYVDAHTNGVIPALGPVNLEIRKGEFFAVVGPSGCGKSTLLDVIGGLRLPTSGKVYFEGTRLGGRVPPEVGIVFQEDATFPWLNVWDNVAFGLGHSGVAAETVRERVVGVLDLCGLRDFAKAYPSQLSGGMKQRVCLARVLVLRPKLILLDEPFAALDAQTRMLMGDELLRLWRATNATILLITHALDEAAFLADRIGIMSARPGRLIEVLDTHSPRDRDSSIASKAEFGAITSHLWSVLREQSKIALGQESAAQ